jgi:hypothetical protein
MENNHPFITNGVTVLLGKGQGKSAETKGNYAQLQQVVG